MRLCHHPVWWQPASTYVAGRRSATYGLARARRGRKGRMSEPPDRRRRHPPHSTCPERGPRMDQGLKEPPAVTAVGVPGAAAPGAGGICAVGEVITTSGLSKTFPGDIHPVVSLDLRVQSGEIFGLLGPNGAGKTTTVGMLSTRVIPTAGSACEGGVDVVAHPALAKQMIGVVAQSNTLDRSLTVWENLYYHCRYFGASARDARAEI